MKNKITYIFILVLIGLYSCNEDTLDIERKGSIAGKVLDDETGSPLDSVKITTNPASTTVFTNAKGEFLLPDILVDDYAVKAELEGYVTGFEASAVTEDSTSDVIIDLRKSKVENKVPRVPKLIFPLDGAEGLGLEVELAWQSSDNDDDDHIYKVELRNGTTREVQKFEVENDTVLVVSNLKLGTSYLWQVAVDDGTNDPVSSAVSEFSTLTSPNNPYLLVKEVNGNNVIFSGNEDSDPDGGADINLYQLTEDTKNSFRPRLNRDIGKIAFLRGIGSDTHIFTMNLDGSNEKQVTNTIPIAGFRLNALDFTWANNGGAIYYPNFDKLYSINPNGGSSTLIYQTTNGSIISEVEVADLDQDLLLIKTNNLQGYNVRIFTYRLSTRLVEKVILENLPGAAGSIDFSANGDKVLYNRDTSGSENSLYRLFTSRLYIYDIKTSVASAITTEVAVGENDFDARFSPSEGAVIFTRATNNTGSTPQIYKRVFGSVIKDKLLFQNAFMPDWE